MNLEFPEISKRLLAASGAGLIALAALSACSGEDTGSDDASSTSDEAAAGEDAAQDEAAAETCEVAPAVEGGGTDFAAPLALCQAGSVEGWDVAVTAVELDATQTILDENFLNEEPADGSQYLMFTLSGTNTGDAASDPFIDLTTAVDIGDMRYEDTCGVLPNDLVDVGEIAPGESFTANGCVFVDSAGVEESVLALSSLLSMDETEVYYKLG
jgi:hypothetical protein